MTIALQVELNQIEHAVKVANSRLQAWNFANANAKREGKEPTTNQATIDWQTKQVQALNARIVEITLQL